VCFGLRARLLVVAIGMVVTVVLTETETGMNLVVVLTAFFVVVAVAVFVLAIVVALVVVIVVFLVFATVCVLVLVLAFVVVLEVVFLVVLEVVVVMVLVLIFVAVTGRTYTVAVVAVAVEEGVVVSMRVNKLGSTLPSPHVAESDRSPSTAAAGYKRRW
jgi:hypothetical protein